MYARVFVCVQYRHTGTQRDGYREMDGNRERGREREKKRKREEEEEREREREHLAEAEVDQHGASAGLGAVGINGHQPLHHVCQLRRRLR